MMKYAYVLLALQLFLPAISLSAEKPSKAEVSAINQYLMNAELDPLQYEFTKTKLGKNTSIIYAYRRKLSPAIPTRYIYYNNGKVRPLNLESLTWAYQDELENIVPSMDTEEIISRYANHHSGEVVKLIETINDIPNYMDSPLDPDMEVSVRKLYRIGERVYVAYFYQQIGGVVCRYRFTFKENGNIDNVNRIVIGEAIGDAKYYE